MKRRGVGGRDSASARMLEAEEASSGQGQDRGCEKRQRFEWRLVKYEALPEYLKDNEFIRDYYRSEWPLKAALLSVFSWHNETLNVWTHLGGFILFVVLTVLSSMEIPEVREMVLGFSRYAAGCRAPGGGIFVFSGTEEYLRKLLDASKSVLPMHILQRD
ncbi:hypothetical protein ACLOJK_002694 [Asimina triloba]